MDNLSFPMLLALVASLAVNVAAVWLLWRVERRLAAWNVAGMPATRESE